MKCHNLSIDNKCLIYHQQRPNCCTSFPNIAHPSCVDEKRCDLNCNECKDCCCNNITIYEGMTLMESLSVSCDECTQRWKEN